jgi:hypothetical protein
MEKRVLKEQNRARLGNNIDKRSAVYTVQKPSLSTFKSFVEIQLECDKANLSLSWVSLRVGEATVLVGLRVEVMCASHSMLFAIHTLKYSPGS